ncbi:MAG: cupredoxin domain-containing protein [Myxococcaceae bacterium]
MARWKILLVLAAAVGIGAGGAVLIFDRAGAPQDRSITIFAKQYSFDPPVIRANRGDRLHLTLVSLDVVHGFYLEGHDLDAQILPQQKTILVRRPSQGMAQVEQEGLDIVAEKTGKFRYRCSHTCGALHPFMAGELIVAPNHSLHGGVGASLGLLVGFALVARRRAPKVAS